MEMAPSSSSDMCPAEDAVQALLDYLVDPVLPPTASLDEVPSLAQQQTVAKQVHAVVVLFNYYQKKRYPDIESLGFESFSKLAVIVKPALVGHMKLLLLSDYAMLDNLEDQLSVTEKTIMDACDISSVLDPTKDAPNIDGWPVMKVAVLLTDSNRENCLLQFSSTTHGVWSVIEKDLDILKNKRKRKSRKLSPEEASAEEAACLQLAFSSVMEVTGIDEHHLSVLESHIVYSLTKEKTATRFYIMQCAQSISKDLEVPIRSVIERLQGPLFKKSYNSWKVTPVVEYFHLLPYSGILLDCLSRKVFSDAMPRVELLKKDDGPSIMKIDGIHDKEDTDGVHGSGVNPSEKVDESRDNPDKNSVKEVSDNGHSSKNPDIIPRDESPITRIEGIHDKEDTEVNPTKRVVEIRDNPDKNPVKEVSENEDNSKNSDTMPRVELQQEDDSPFTRIDEIHAKEDSEGINDSDVNPSKTVTEHRDNPGEKSDKEVSQNGDNPRESSTISDSAASEANQSNAEALGKRGDSAKATCCLSNSSTGPRDMDIDNSSPVCRQNENIGEINRNDIICYQRRRRGAPGRGSSFKAQVDNSISKPHIIDLNDRDGDAGSMTSSVISSDQNGLLMGDLSVVLPLDQTSNTMAYDKNALSETALKLLLNKRRNLSGQLRTLEDEIADCDREIQTILDGVEDDMTSQMNSIIDACKSVSLKAEPGTEKDSCSLALDQRSPLNRRKRLAEAAPDLQNSCQELDNICDINNWNLPSYNVSPADGKFQAKVTVKGLDFEFSEGGDLHSSRRLARESAAAKMITRLQSMVAEKGKK